MNNSDMILTPLACHCSCSLTLYTSIEFHEQSEKLKGLLVRGGFVFQEKNVSARPEFGKALEGNSVGLPAVMCGDKSWSLDNNDINLDDSVLHASLLRFCVDTILANATSGTTAADSGGDERLQADIHFVPEGLLSDNNDKESVPCEQGANENNNNNNITGLLNTSRLQENRAYGGRSKSKKIFRDLSCMTNSTVYTSSTTTHFRTFDDINFNPKEAESSSSSSKQLHSPIPEVDSSSSALLSVLEMPSITTPSLSTTPTRTSATTSIRFTSNSNNANRTTPGTPRSMTTTMHSSSSHPVFDDILLPNGEVASLAELTRRLCAYADHRWYVKDGTTYYYIRGFEAMQLVASLFFDLDDPLELVEFAKKLIQYGILYNYTPHLVVTGTDDQQPSDLDNTFLVLQPFRTPHVLNTFVVWPSDHTASCAQDPMDVILRLSRQMDLICSNEEQQQQQHGDDQEDDEDDLANTALFQTFQVDVCQLQCVGFPASPVERVTFALNLFNLIVRHAMIVAKQRGWSWPTSLEQRNPFFRKIGYNVAGEWVDLEALQASLYGFAHNDDDEPRLVVKHPHSTLFQRMFRWSRPNTTSSRVDGTASLSSNAQVYYRTPAIRTDPRILLATTWGTRSSPVAVTAYPNRLQEALQTAAEVYCQAHVDVVPGTGLVILPTLLSWHRHDFGGRSKASHVLTEILPYLSSRQLRQIEAARQHGRLQVVFADNGDYSWECGLALPSQPTQQQQHLEAADNNAELLGHFSRTQELLPASERRWMAVSGGGDDHQTSRGRDIQLTPPKRRGDFISGMPREETETDYLYEDDDDEEYDGNSSLDVSAITMGSEFERDDPHRAYL